VRILVAGCNGQVGWELVRCLQPLGEVVAVDRRQMDLADLDGVKTTLVDIEPDVIVNAAAYTAVDNAEENEDEANLINGHAAGALAIAAKKIGALLVHYSTDYVFDGKKSSPYTEDDTPSPINAYGRSKLMGEQAIQSADMDSIILRTSWVYSARGNNFLQTILKLSQEKEELSIVADQIGAPTWARFIAESSAHVIRQSLLEKRDSSFKSGLYHLTAAGETSWCGFAQAIIEQVGRLPDFLLELNEIKPILSQDYLTPARRPMNSRLVTAKFEKHFGLKIPSWDVALQLCLAEYR